mmetsp:Transcript_54249/g.155960  ORF Transcript_54249/g.155960 Transcript_54249/m.155960 type:complete len:88 (-) Transcript_54249:26-289(-)
MSCGTRATRETILALRTCGSIAAQPLWIAEQLAVHKMMAQGPWVARSAARLPGWPSRKGPRGEALRMRCGRSLAMYNRALNTSPTKS